MRPYLVDFWYKIYLDAPTWSGQVFKTSNKKKKAFYLTIKSDGFVYHFSETVGPGSVPYVHVEVNRGT